MKNPKIKINTWGIQVKVLVLFLITLLSVITGAYFVRENERILRQTLNDLDRPESKLTLLHQILTFLPEAENKIRYFALTNDEAFYDEYMYLIEAIKSNIQELNENVINDSLTQVKLDSVQLLLEQRKHHIDSYIDLKNKREKFDFSQRAYNNARKLKTDTIQINKKTSTREIVKYDTVTVPINEQSQEVPPKNKGFFNKLKRVFSKESKRNPPPAQADTLVLPAPRIESDTINVIDHDTLKKASNAKIDKELNRIRKQDLDNYLLLREKEFDLLQNSSDLIDQITNIFKRLEISLTVENELRTSVARKQASQSLMIIAIVSIIALGLILLLVIFIFSSVKKSNRYKKELIFANIQANELAQVKEEFLANMSHEIRTPLNAIIGFSDQLVKTPLNEEQAKYMNAIRKSSKHLLETVNDILDLSRLVAGKFQIDKVPFRLIDVFEDLIPPFVIQANEKGLELINECYSDEKVYFEGDPLRIRQILYNLLSNAIKFTNKGKITINCKALIFNSEATVVIQISDTGIGIDPDHLEGIFEDFKQVESSSARAYAGSGLGLAISRRLARMQNGDISVESQLGKGSTFSLKLTLPVIDMETSKPITETGINIDHESLRGKNLLVVDDDLFNIMLSKIIGEKSNMNVLVASDGYKAKEILETTDCDIVMTDLQMPGLTGIELVKFIRTHKIKKIADLPVIAFTANKFEKYNENLIAQGFNEVLQKPFLEDEFLNRLTYYLSGRSDYDSGNTNITPQDSNKPLNSPYSLGEIRKFANGKTSQEIDIINTFIISAQNSMSEMQLALEEKNYVIIKEIAHRLLTSYGHLKVTDSLEILNELDQLNLSAVDEEMVVRLIMRLQNNNKILFSDLHKEIELLKNL